MSTATVARPPLHTPLEAPADSIPIVAPRASMAPRTSIAAAYLELTKPRILVMVLVTIVAGAWATGQPLVGWTILHTVLGTAAIAAGASAANQWLERRTDALMARTARRPLPSQTLSSAQVLAFAAALSAGGATYLALLAPARSALLAAATWALYVLVYTPLKTRTPSNTAIGAVAGALPVLIGWTAAGGALDLKAAAWFGVVYLWQFPHFMAIAWLYREDYGAAGLKMLPVVEPTGVAAGWQAVAASAALLPISLLPLLGLASVAGVALVVVALGFWYFAASVAFLRQRDRRSATRLLRVSLVHLPALMALLAFAVA